MPVYHANYKSEEPRDGGFANNVTFAAEDDAAAEAIADLIDAAVDAKRVSLTKRIYAGNLDQDHPEGSRTNYKVIAKDAGGAVYTFKIRNVKDDVPPAAIEAFFKGEAYNAGGYVLAALGAPLRLPNTGNPIVKITATPIDVS